jgi:hypothetical protein
MAFVARFPAAVDSWSIVSSSALGFRSMSVAKSHISNAPHVGHAHLRAASPRKSASARERHSGQTASGHLFSSITPPRFGKAECWGGALRRERATPRAARDIASFHRKECIPRPMGSAVRSESSSKIEPRAETFHTGSAPAKSQAAVLDLIMFSYHKSASPTLPVITKQDGEFLRR